jgi:hypothetical protein
MFFNSVYVRCFQDALVGVEIWGVSRELFELNTRSASGGQKLLDRSTAMDRRAIPNDQKFARYLSKDVLQKAYYVLSLEGALLLHHQGLAL